MKKLCMLFLLISGIQTSCSNNGSLSIDNDTPFAGRIIIVTHDAQGRPITADYIMAAHKLLKINPPRPNGMLKFEIIIDGARREIWAPTNSRHFPDGYYYLIQYFDTNNCDSDRLIIRQKKVNENWQEVLSRTRRQLGACS